MKALAKHWARADHKAKLKERTMNEFTNTNDSKYAGISDTPLTDEQVAKLLARNEPVTDSAIVTTDDFDDEAETTIH